MYSLPERAHATGGRPCLLTLAALLAVSNVAAAQQLTLTIDSLAAQDLELRGITASLTAGAPAQLDLRIQSIRAFGEDWRNVKARCSRLVLTERLLACRAGVIELGEPIPIVFTFDRRSRRLDATLRPGGQERWRLRARFDGPGEAVQVDLENARIGRLKPWMPAAFPDITAGTLSGQLALTSRDALKGRIVLDGVAFSNPEGTRAAERVGATLEVQARRSSSGWNWSGRGILRSGEVYWQPAYLKAAGQAIEARGELGETRIRIDEAKASLPEIGVIEAQGVVWDRSASRLLSARVEARNLPLPAIYEQWLKPPLAGTALADVRTAGSVSIEAEFEEGALRAADLVLDNVSVEHPDRRFAAFGARGRVPWRAEQPTRARISLEGGEIVGLPFGEVELPMTLKGTHLVLAPLSVPFLGGTVRLADFAAGHGEEGWQWSFSGELTQLSVALLTQGLGLPSMRGTLSGVVPRMSYANSRLVVGGELSFLVFDGIVTVRNLTLADPFGYAPRLAADLDMRHIDLDLLTRTFSFGSMTGRVDVTIGNLLLTNWIPVRFDARIASSPGDYPRSISQRAVQNLSELGGGGAASGLQIAILGLFDHFGYQRLGLSCALRNNICMMDGIEPAEQGRGYVIVKGGGIPALSVIGYNREVSWPVLVRRLRRIMQENVQPVIK